MNLNEHTSVAYASVILRSESFCSIIDICSLINKDANVAYVIEKNEFDEPGYVK